MSLFPLFEIHWVTEKNCWGKKTESMFYLDRCYFNGGVDLYTRYYLWEMMGPAVELVPTSLPGLSVSLFLLDPNIHGWALDSWGWLSDTRQWFTGPTGPWTLYSPLSSICYIPVIFCWIMEDICVGYISAAFSMWMPTFKNISNSQTDPKTCGFE